MAVTNGKVKGENGKVKGEKRTLPRPLCKRGERIQFEVVSV